MGRSMRHVGIGERDHVLGLVIQLHRAAAHDRQPDQPSNHEHVHHQRDSRAFLLVVVGAPDAAHLDGLGTQLQRRQLLGEERGLDVGPQRAPKRLLHIGMPIKSIVRNRLRRQLQRRQFLRRQHIPDVLRQRAPQRTIDAVRGRIRLSSSIGLEVNCSGGSFSGLSAARILPSNELQTDSFSSTGGKKFSSARLVVVPCLARRDAWSAQP